MFLYTQHYNVPYLDPCARTSTAHSSYYRRYISYYPTGLGRVCTSLSLLSWRYFGSLRWTDSTRFEIAGSACVGRNRRGNQILTPVCSRRTQRVGFASAGSPGKNNEVEVTVYFTTLEWRLPSQLFFKNNALTNIFNCISTAGVVSLQGGNHYFKV